MKVGNFDLSTCHASLAFHHFLRFVKNHGLRFISIFIFSLPKRFNNSDDDLMQAKFMIGPTGLKPTKPIKRIFRSCTSSPIFSIRRILGVNMKLIRMFILFNLEFILI